MATSAKSLKKQQFKPQPGVQSIGWIAAGVLAVIGLAAWIYQLIAGMEVTGLGQQVVWGAYIAAFFTAAGAGAGLLALAGVNAYRPRFPGTLRRNVLALALACFVAGGLLILMDLGNPVKIFVMITAFRLNSMMTWDFWLLIVAGLVTLAYLFQDQENRTLGALSVLAAVVVVVVEGWMLASLAARPMWASGLTAVTFLVGATIAGLSLLALLPDDEKADKKPAKGAPALLFSARTGLTWVLAAGLLLALAEVLTGLVSRDPRVSAEMRTLLSGTIAPVFWFHLVVGLIVPLLLIGYRGSLKLAAALAIIGVLAEKVWMLAAGQAASWVNLPNGSYFPSWVELAAIAGMVGLAALVYFALKQYVVVKRLN